MKRFLFGFLAVLFLILNTIPYLHIFADDMPTSSQYEMLGAYALSTLITSGEATELDFSDYTETDTSFLIDLGEAIFTGDWSGLAEDGLEWLGETADSVYDSYKEYVSQWKYDHLGIMYSNWFPDEQIRVGPDDGYSLAKPLRELFTPRDNIIRPDIPSSYSWLDICGTYKFGYEQILFNQMPMYLSMYDQTTPITPVYSIDNYSYYLAQNSQSFNNQITSSSTYNVFGNVYVYGILDINIVENDNIPNRYDIICSHSPYSANTYYKYPNGFCNLLKGLYFNTSTNYFIPASGFSQNNEYSLIENLYTTGFDNAVNYVYNHFRHVNIYVNNVLWVSVESGPNYPIVIPNQLTIYNNQPLEYSFPDNTHIDLPDLTNIIRNAINSSGVVMWSDIADTYIDVNGQTAVAVTKIVRNDYDNLYMEQYPYPAMLVGMTDQTKFNEHLLDNSHAYLSPMGTVVQETVNVLPSELVGVLAIGAILTIFAVIINRLLE